MDIVTVGAKRTNLAKLIPLLRYKRHNNVPHASLHKQLVCLPERGLEDLSRGALFGVVVVSVEEVSEHGLVSWNVHCLHAVYSLGAGLRQRQAWPPIWTPLVVFNAPEETGDSRSLRAFNLFIRGLISIPLSENSTSLFSFIYLLVCLLLCFCSFISWIPITLAFHGEIIISMQRAKQEHFRLKLIMFRILLNNGCWLDCQFSNC